MRSASSWLILLPVWQVVNPWYSSPTTTTGMLFVMTTLWRTTSAFAPTSRRLWTTTLFRTAGHEMMIRRRMTATTNTSSDATSSGSSSSITEAGEEARSSAAGTSATEAPVATTESKPVKVRRILSGVQPTGTLHLGNYLGAIRQWVDFQNQGSSGMEGDEAESIRTENFFCVVDLHAITMPHDPSALAESSLASAALYLAAGIDPTKSRVFIQSHVPAHSELAWLLNCITPMNWLERMIQFKDKAKKQGESVGVGLFTYPTLMAADILLYQADQVPVGEDQRQHLELARDICRRFHDLFCKGNAFKKRCKAAGIASRPVFVEPNPMIVKTSARIMSLSDGTSKMSKSDPNDASRINLLDEPAVIRDKIKRCKTDSERGLEWDNPDRPEATNLLNIYLAVQPERTREDIEQEVKDMTWGEFKPALAEAIIRHLEPIQQRYRAVREDDRTLEIILREGAEAANAVASQTLYATRIAMGFAAAGLPPSKA